MAPAPMTPESSGTTTPTGTTASALTKAGIKHMLPDNTPSLADLDASHMTYTLTAQHRPVPDLASDEIKAQKICTDHMVTARWTASAGWETPELKPYGPLAIMPNASVLHYATECFEGLKLYRGYDGKLRLFRVMKNCERMRKSAARIALPDFDAEQLAEMIKALCAQDGAKWLPQDRAGSFLYIRPTLIATDPALGVQRPQEALLYVILAVFPDMSKSLANAPPALNGSATSKPSTSGLKLLASSEDTIRAWPGGFGYAKVGANYGPSLVAQGEARARGFDQVLWLFGSESYVTEAGASNFFVVIKHPSSGRLQLITAPLERLILDGVTRRSILEMVSADGELEVVERRFTMDEIVSAGKEGRLVEAFAAGTAFFIAPVERIHWRGEDLEVPMDGGFAMNVKQRLTDIMWGNVGHEWGIVVPEKA